jgi:hypothetical protein
MGFSGCSVAAATARDGVEQAAEQAAGLAFGRAGLRVFVDVLAVLGVLMVVVALTALAGPRREKGVELASVEPDSFAGRAHLDLHAVAFEGSELFFADWTTHGYSLLFRGWTFGTFIERLS